MSEQKPPRSRSSLDRRPKTELARSSAKSSSLSHQRPLLATSSSLATMALSPKSASNNGTVSIRRPGHSLQHAIRVRNLRTIYDVHQSSPHFRTQRLPRRSSTRPDRRRQRRLDRK